MDGERGKKDGAGLKLYNTKTRKVEYFTPISPDTVKMYVCGPTVYGSPHLGHARSIVIFDLLHRLLRCLGYKVLMVRNITDVGHIESDLDEGEDKIVKRARELASLPAEIAHKYTLEFWRLNEKMNCLEVSIEPLASAHIQDQINLIKRIMERGYAYEVNGSVYFDVVKFHNDYGYGRLSGRKIEELKEYTRELRGTHEKRNPYDFALWKRAYPGHIMRWESPWGEGFPGWHIECSAMSLKYLGEEFDIHGGGIDLVFPHHECEMAQNIAATGKEGPRFWVHNNLITIEGKKMSKQLGNYIEPLKLFERGDVSPMELRFYLLSGHYRSPLNYTEAGLKASQKSFRSLIRTWNELMRYEGGSGKTSSLYPSDIKSKVIDILCDDLDTPSLYSFLFSLSSDINSMIANNGGPTGEELKELKDTFSWIMMDVLGIVPYHELSRQDMDLSSRLVEIILNVRSILRSRKEYQLSDMIRNELNKIGIVVNDTVEGVKWEFSKG